MDQPTTTPKAMAKVRLDVGGRVFCTTVETLKKHPGTRLTDLINKEYANTNSDVELFFDRNSDIFSVVLDYYRNGTLHVPKHICPQSTREELEFWKIGEDKIHTCCWSMFYSIDDGKEVMDDFETTGQRRIKVRSFRNRVWEFLDNPRSSRPAQAWNILYLLLLTISYFISCLQSNTMFRVAFTQEKIDAISNIVNFTNPKLRMYFTSASPKFFTWFNNSCQIVFTLDFLLRFLVSFNKREFFKDPINIIDMFVIPAVWTTFIMNYVPEFLYDDGALTLYIILRSFAVLRLARVFRLAKQFSDLRIMLLSVKASKRELLLFVTVILIFTCIFGRLLYAMEIHNEQSFPDMFISLWWAVITMTTVGYGDVYPKTIGGRIIGGFCAVSGLLVLAMPVAVIARNFGERYSFHKNMQRREIRMKMDSKYTEAK